MKKYILLLFLGVTCTLNAQMLNIPYAKQEQSNWCGAACAQSVIRYLSHYVPQCALMEYVRSVSPGYGLINCCDTVHDCNEGIDLYGTQGSVQYILSVFSEINSIGYGYWLDPDYIDAYIVSNRPLIISLKSHYGNAYHGVVIRGISNSKISYMDPSPSTNGVYQQSTWLTLTTGFSLPYYWDKTLIIGDELFPDHCFNGKCDKDKDEDDVDCGGPCKPCNAPPLGNCFNCKKDSDEEGIDCGGDCPPCSDITEEIIISSTNKPPSRVAAHKKVSTSGTVEVLSGKEVDFITSDTGTIELKKGFHAKAGSVFNARTMVDLSEFSRICRDICRIHWSNYAVYRNIPTNLRIHDLLYAVRVKYEIYDKRNRFIYKNDLKISRNGDFGIWDGTTGAINNNGTVKYTLYYTVYYCDGSKKDYTHKFVVMNYGVKSPANDPDDPENPTPALSPPANNTTHQEENTVPNFSVTPNPNAGTFQLETNFPLTDIANLKITNTVGAVVYESQHLTSNEIQLQNTAPGLYFVVMVLRDGTVLTQKAMVQR